MDDVEGLSCVDLIPATCICISSDTKISLTRTFSSIDFSTVSQNDNTVNQHKTMVNEGDGWGRGGEGDSLLLAMTPTFSTMTPVLR